MKCPECDFVCAETRDICPRCLVDMRPFKRSIGLPIANPKATYEALLAKASAGSKGSEKAAAKVAAKKAKAPGKEKEPAGKTVPAGDVRKPAVKKAAAGTAPQAVAAAGNKPAAATERRSFFSLLKAVFGGGAAKSQTETVQGAPEKAPAKAAASKGPAPQAPKAVAPAAGFNAAVPQPAADEQLPPVRPIAAQIRSTPAAAPAAPQPQVLDFSQCDDLSSVLDSLIGDGDITIQGFEAKTRKTLDEQEDETPPSAGPLMGRSLGESVEALIEPARHRRGFEEDAEDIADLRRILPLQRKELIQISAQEYFGNLPVAEGSDENAALFSAAFADMSGEADESFELGADQFIQPLSPEEADLYFDLALESLRDPDAARKYASEIHTSERRALADDNRELNEKLREVEESFSAAFSLRGRRKGEAEEEAKPLPPAPLFRRMRAFALDITVICLLAALFAVVTWEILFPDLEQLLAGSAHFDEIDAVNLAAFFLQYLVLFSVLYPLLSLCVWGTTFGCKFSGLVIRGPFGQTVRKSNLAARALLFPLTLVLFGWVPLLIGRRALHDTLAKTQVGRAPEAAA